MTIYVMITLCLLLFALLSETKYFSNKIYKTIFLCVGSFGLFFVSAFRLNTGYDYPPYARNFVRLIDTPLADLSSERMEKGYLLLIRYIQLFTNNYQWIFIIISLIMILLISIVLIKYCNNPSMGLLAFYLLGFYFNSMNFMRSVVASCILLFAYKFIKEKNFIRFFVLVLLASTFHISVLLFIPFYFILQIKFNYVTLAIYSIIGGVLYTFSVPIVSFITKYVYVAYNPLSSASFIGSIPSVYALLIILILVSGLLLRKDLEKKYKWGTILISATFFDFYFGFLGSKHSILGRFALYFGPIMALLLVPQIIKISLESIRNNKDDKLLYKIRNYFCLAATTVSSIVFFAYSLYDNYNGVIPHDWIWNLS